MFWHGWLLLLGVGVMTSLMGTILGQMFFHYLVFDDDSGEVKQPSVGARCIGGLGILGAVLISLKMAHVHQWMSSAEVGVVASSALFLFVIGVADDLWRLSYRMRGLSQVLATGLMVYGGGIVLADLGEIMPSIAVELGSLAPVLTVFATLMVIHAFRKMDEMENLAGAVALVSLLLLAIVMLGAEQPQWLVLLAALISGVVGVLGFNLLCRLRGRALTWLGSGGAMVLGLLLAWLLIGMSQGAARVITPVTALWLLAIPLIDVLAVLIRRVGHGQPLFAPDRFHLHHLLLRAGFRATDAVLMIVLLQGLLGGVGLAGLFEGVDEGWMLAGFLAVAAGWVWAVFRTERCLPALRRLQHRLGWAKAESQGVFVGHFGLEAAVRVACTLQDEVTADSEYDLQVYQLDKDSDDPRLYALLETPLAEGSRCAWELEQRVRRLRRSFSTLEGVEVRQYVRRAEHERRVQQRIVAQDRRQIDHR